ncbi:MAG: hypothetical protein ACQERN_04855 [Thermodesulfobacteriota bacterium]
MTKFTALCMFLIPVFLIVSGCSSSKTTMPEVDIKAFQKRCTYSFDMQENAKRAGVTILSVPQTVLANMPLDDSVENILYVKLQENEHLNIDRHLVRNLEYAYLRKKNLLQVIFDLPVVYMLSKSVHFRIEACVARKSKDRIVGEKIGKQVSFFWSPQVTTLESENQFSVLTYVDPVDHEYDKKNDLTETAEQEKHMTNMQRLAPDYRSVIEKFTR